MELRQIPPASRRELLELVEAVYTGDALSDKQIPEDMLPQVFMPMEFGVPEGLDPESIGMIFGRYKYRFHEMAGDYPKFFIVEFLNKEDTQAFLKLYKEQVREELKSYGTEAKP